MVGHIQTTQGSHSLEIRDHHDGFVVIEQLRDRLLELSIRTDQTQHYCKTRGSRIPGTDDLGVDRRKLSGFIHCDNLPDEAFHLGRLQP